MKRKPAKKGRKGSLGKRAGSRPATKSRRAAAKQKSPRRAKAGGAKAGTVRGRSEGRVRRRPGRSDPGAPVRVDKVFGGLPVMPERGFER